MTTLSQSNIFRCFNSDTIDTPFEINGSKTGDLFYGASGSLYKCKSVGVWVNLLPPLAIATNTPILLSEVEENTQDITFSPGVYIPVPFRPTLERGITMTNDGFGIATVPQEGVYQISISLGITNANSVDFSDLPILRIEYDLLSDPNNWKLTYQTRFMSVGPYVGSDIFPIIPTTLDQVEIACKIPLEANTKIRVIFGDSNGTAFRLRGTQPPAIISRTRMEINYVANK